MSYSAERMEDMQSRVHCDIWASCPPEYEDCAECKRKANEETEEEE
jgi:hypothetical protein